MDENLNTKAVSGTGTQIPRKIHYCWFGGNTKPDIFPKCIESWKRFASDYEITEWNENNFNYKQYKYAEQAYNKEKYAFVSDVARFHILYENGGIYLDTDVELIKPIDNLLNDELFLTYAQNGLISSGLIFGSVKGNWLLKEVLGYYSVNDFLLPNGRPNTTTVCTITTDILRDRGYNLDKATKKQNGIRFYSWEYFDPYNVETKEMRIDDRTYSIHHYAATWKSESDMRIYKIGLAIKKIVGEKKYDSIARLKHRILG